MRGRKPEIATDQGALTAIKLPILRSYEAKKEWKRVITILIERKIFTPGKLAVAQRSAG